MSLFNKEQLEVNSVLINEAFNQYLKIIPKNYTIDGKDKNVTCRYLLERLDNRFLKDYSTKLTPDGEVLVSKLKPAVKKTFIEDVYDIERIDVNGNDLSYQSLKKGSSEWMAFELARQLPYRSSPMNPLIINGDVQPEHDVAHLYEITITLSDTKKITYNGFSGETTATRSVNDVDLMDATVYLIAYIAKRCRYIRNKQTEFRVNAFKTNRSNRGS